MEVDWSAIDKKVAKKMGRKSMIMKLILAIKKKNS